MLRRFCRVCHQCKARLWSPVLMMAGCPRKAACWPCARSNAYSEVWPRLGERGGRSPAIGRRRCHCRGIPARIVRAPARAATPLRPCGDPRLRGAPLTRRQTACLPREAECTAIGAVRASTPGQSQSENAQSRSPLTQRGFARRRRRGPQSFPIIARHRIVYSICKIFSNSFAESTLQRRRNAGRCHMLTVYKLRCWVRRFWAGVAIAEIADPLCRTPSGPCRPPGPRAERQGSPASIKPSHSCSQYDPRYRADGGRSMGSVRNWAAGSAIVALILLSPIVAFLVVILAEMLIDLVMEVGVPVVCAIAAARHRVGAIPQNVVGPRAGASIGTGDRRNGDCSLANLIAASASLTSALPG
jgi:hypothetical protein